MKIPPWLLAVIFSASVLLAGVTGFFIGEKRGIRKGANAGAYIASMNLEADKDFLLLMEGAISDGADSDSDDNVRELMISGLNTFLPARTLLAADPFSQEYTRFDRDQSAISAAVGRLKSKSISMEYNK